MRITQGAVPTPLHCGDDVRPYKTLPAVQLQENTM